jgi:hypothetical protein
MVNPGRLLWRTFVRGLYKTTNLDSPYSAHDYGTNWSKQRRRCLDRDDHTCRVCETPQTALDRELSVHHIRPRSMFDGTPRSMNALDNLVSLCPSCHGTFEGQFVECTVSEFVRRARESNG